MDVRVTETGGLDADKHLLGAGLRRRDLLDLERARVVMDDGSLHAWLLPRQVSQDHAPTAGLLAIRGSSAFAPCPPHTVLRADDAGLLDRHG